MSTGINTGLGAALMAEQFRRLGGAARETRPWIDAAYCLDATDALPAGSMVRYQIEHIDDRDWYCMPSMIERLPPNKGKMVVSVNDIQEMRQSFEGLVMERVDINYTVGGGSRSKPAGELIIRSW